MSWLVRRRATAASPDPSPARRRRRRQPTSLYTDWRSHVPCSRSQAIVALTSGLVPAATSSTWIASRSATAATRRVTAGVGGTAGSPHRRTARCSAQAMHAVTPGTTSGPSTTVWCSDTSRPTCTPAGGCGQWMAGAHDDGETGAGATRRPRCRGAGRRAGPAGVGRARRARRRTPSAGRAGPPRPRRGDRRAGAARRRTRRPRRWRSTPGPRRWRRRRARRRRRAGRRRR